MSYLFSPPNLTSGIDDALISTGHAVPIFPIMIMVFVYMLVLIGGSNNQKRRTGNADYPYWFLLAGLTTFMLSLIFTLPNALNGSMIDLTVLGIVVAITILSAVWYFLSSVRGEQE